MLNSSRKTAKNEEKKNNQREKENSVSIDWCGTMKRKFELNATDRIWIHYDLFK